MLHTLLQIDPDSAVEAVTSLDVVLRIGLAAVFGMVVGYERKLSEKPVDGRTMALIAAGAAGFTLMGVEIASQASLGHNVQVDPTRVLAYIISGIGFLGAGAILHSKRGITGLTTASSIWTSAGVGAACGLGLFLIAFTLFGVVFAMLWIPWLGSFKSDADALEDD
ncbi:MAG: MgtC/SapB family protein [Phycisphaerales bacterium]|nr:MgtC/SapB family protein [Phycisphaerales bacterium]MCB9837321.1 MgtC/SapB family protein [Phycisphaera sp.]